MPKTVAELLGVSEGVADQIVEAQRFYAKNGCIYERTHGGALSRIVATFTPHGRGNVRFGCPDAQAMAERALPSFNS